MKKTLLIIALLLSLVSWANAATYYVRTNGNDSNDGLTNSAGGAWLTIDHAADSVSAGDTIRVQAGSYNEVVSCGVTGTSGNPITFVADGTVTLRGFTLSSMDYMRFIGFTINDIGESTVTDGFVLTDCEYVEIWHCTVNNADTSSSDSWGVDADGGSNHNLVVIGNTFHHCRGGVSVVGDNALLSHNEVLEMDDNFYVMGDNSIMRNNYMHTINNPWGGAPHVDGMQSFTDGQERKRTTQMVCEGNLFDDSTGIYSDHHFYLISDVQDVGSGDCLTRYNVTHDIGSVFSQVQSNLNDFYMVYNTIAGAMQYSPGAYCVQYFSGYVEADTSVMSNIFYDAVTDGGYLYSSYASGDYNYAYNPGYSGSWSQAPFSNEANRTINLDPVFVNYAGDDFHLQSSSNAIGVGGPLTQTNGSGSGTSFSVDEGGYFRGDNTSINQYGGNLVVGDQITVGTDTVRIASISGNTITVTESFTWADGENVYYGDDTTPDVGAYPYKASGYTLSGTYAKVAGVVTVTPNDASLIRMVVVFEDGIPIGADSISPFSISGVGNGSLVVRMYPFYASETVYVDATTGDDVTPPDFTNNNMGSIPYTTSREVSISSNENCTAYFCENGVGGCSSSTPYTSMTQFSTTGGMTHYHTMTGLSAGYYQWWVRGKDGSDNVSDEIPCEHFITLTIQEEEPPPPTTETMDSIEIGPGAAFH